MKFKYKVIKLRECAYEPDLWEVVSSHESPTEAYNNLPEPVESDYYYYSYFIKASPVVEEWC